MIAGAILAAIAIAFVLWQQPWNTKAEPERPTISADAGVAIAAQIRALGNARNESEFVDAAGDSDAARDWAKETYANVGLIDATDIRLRFVKGGNVAARADGATEATVEVSWRPGPRSGLAGQQTKQAEATFVLDPLTSDTFAIRDAAQGTGALPLWLAGKLETTRTGGTTVVTVDGGDKAKPIVDQTESAHAAVNKVVTGAKTRLVVISPRTQGQAAALLGQSTASIKQIAAVTTTLDASNSAKAALVVVLNPAVFAAMDARAAQVVMSHEATHLMTDAATADIEPWVAEGFADFVALRDDKAPLSVSAGQILRSVRKDGAPDRLPTAADFGTSQHGLGGTYESAWMIFRMLGDRFGDEDILRFYNAVLDGRPTAQATESTFGLSVAEITRDWRAYLVKSASITS